MTIQDNANDYGAGQPDASGSEYSDQGDQGGNGASQGGDPGNQGGQQPGQSGGADELQKLRDQNKALNKHLVEARRAGYNPQAPNRQPQGQQNGQGQGQEGDENPFNDPAGQYGIALQVATGNVRAGLENILDLYPELPPEVVKQVRRNPWAYADQKSYMGADADNALLDIEQYLADYVENNDNDQGNGEGDNSANPKRPASFNPNSAPENGANGDGQPDPMEDWTMPMDQLEKKANKVKTQMARQNPR